MLEDLTSCLDCDSHIGWTEEMQVVEMQVVEMQVVDTCMFRPPLLQTIHFIL